MTFYNIAIISVYFIFLAYVLLKRKDLFSPSSFMYIISSTWITGALFCENGFFAWPNDYVPNPHNYSALFLLAIMIASYCCSKIVYPYLLKSYSLRVNTTNEAAKQFILNPRSLNIINIGITTVMLLYIGIILNIGAPFFDVHPDLARAVFWKQTAPPFLKRFMTVFLPGIFVLTYLYNKGKLNNLLLKTNFALYLAICILLSQKSNILLLIFPLYMAYYYKNFKSVNVIKQVKRGAAIFAFLFLLMSYLEYHNMTEHLYVFGKTVDKSFSAGLLIFSSRLTMGQGEPYWRIFNDYIKKGEKNLGFDGIEKYYKTALNSRLLNMGVPREKSFEYWITKKLTADWFAKTRNLVITYIGEGIIYFKTAGALIAAFIMSVTLFIFDNLLIYTCKRYKYVLFVFVLMIFHYKIRTWMQMGSFFNIFRIGDWFYIMILFFILYVISKTVNAKIKTLNINKNGI